jgi:pyridoxal 5'-phosphate synthase pdxT subunit
MRVAVLAVQGAFIEHIKRMKQLGVECIELRQKADLEQDFEGLILPGGESTVQSLLLRELGMFELLQERIRNGLPVLATCAGLILLAENLSNDKKTHFQTLPITVKRNAYGRQLGSFFTYEDIADIKHFPMEFIRAPYIEDVKAGVQVLARVKDNIVAVRYQNQLAMAFHPELVEDTRLHEYFLRIIKSSLEKY